MKRIHAAIVKSRLPGDASCAHETPMEESRRSVAIGLAAAFAAACLGAGWQIATRAGATTALAPLDLALLRYAVPALALLPVLWRGGTWPSEAPKWLAAPLFVGGGLPFGLVAMAGAVFAPVAHMGALMPGTMPAFTALLAWLLLREPIGPARAFGFAVVLAGATTIASGSFGEWGAQVWIGDALFLGAAMLWAVFSIATRRAALDPWWLSAALAAASFVAVVPLWLAFGGDLRAADWRDLSIQFVWQGLFAGLLGTWTYALAIRHLGAARAALSGALVPALSAAGGMAILGEVPDARTLSGVGLTMLGLFIAVRTASRYRKA